MGRKCDGVAWFGIIGLLCAIALVAGCTGNSSGSVPAGGRAVITDGAVDVPIDKTLVVEFSKTVVLDDPGGVTLVAGGVPVAVTVTGAGTNLLIEPVSPLEKNRQYILTIPAGTVAGQTEEIPISFTTVAAGQAFTGITPADGAVDVPVDQTITATFSEAVTLGDPSGVTLATGGTPVAVTITGAGTNLLIDPGSPLQNHRLYTLTIPADTVAGMGEAISISFTTVAAGQAFTGITPADGAVDVPVDQTITATFSEAVTLGDTSGVTLAAGGTPVAATVTGEGTNLLIDPVSPLQNNRLYTVTIPSGSVVGMGEAISISFTTIAPAQAFTGIIPADGAVDVPITQTVTATFSETVTLGDTSGVTLAAGGAPVAVTVTGAGTNLLIEPVSPLQNNRLYTITIPAGSVAGMGEAISTSFTTVAAAQAFTGITPADGAVDVPVDQTITATFSEAVTLGDTSGVTLAAGGTPVAATVTGAGKNLLIDPVSPLQNNRLYTVTIPSGSVVGMGEAISISFTTVAAVQAFTGITPIDGAVDVPITQTITATFSETVTLGDTSGVTLVAGGTPVAVTVTGAGTNLLIDPVPLLEKNRLYTLTVPADTVVGIGEEISISFTTVQIEFDERTGIIVSDVPNASIGRSDMSNNIVVSESGIIHVVWKVPDVMSATPAAADGIYYSRSTDGGASFEPGIKVRSAVGLATGNRSYAEPEIACSGPDNVYISCPTADSRMELFRSTDRGASWEDPLVTGDGVTVSEHKHIVAVGDDVYISANDGDLPQAASVDNGGNTFLRSVDAGLSFQPPVTGLMGYPLHALLVNPLNGDIYIVGTEPTGVNEPTPVYYVRSRDGGVTFEAPVNSEKVITHAGYCFDRLGRIVVVGRTGTLLIGDMNIGTWEQSDTIGTASKPLQSTMTVDGDNTIYRVGTDAADNRIHVTYSIDNGAVFSDEAVDDGSYPNAASSVNMSGAAMVYMRGGVIYYAYRKP